MHDIIKNMLQGDSYALSRLITMVENDRISIPDLMREIYSHQGHSYFLGITGPPGAGKSTLTSNFTGAIRKETATVGVIACDPSSPFSGGALLGDRIRMGNHFLDDGVFVRSMATRGNLGGLPQKVHAVAALLNAFGKDFVLLETVGVGQTEVDVRCIADTNILVLTPMAGDYIQAMKSGIIEIADIFVINKTDLGEANVTAEDIAYILDMRVKPGEWKPPIIKTQAIDGKGTKECLGAIDAHRRFLDETGLGSKRREQNRRRVFAQHMKETLLKEVKKCLQANDSFNEYLVKVEKEEVNPYTASDEILGDKDIWKEVFDHLCGRDK